MNPTTDSDRRNLTTADLARTGARKPAADARAENLDPAERELMDRERMEREQMDRQRLDRERMDSERSDRQRMDSERADRKRADRERAGGQRTDAQGAERERAAEPAQIRSEKLEALFTPDAANRFRSQWTDIQSRFVDDPKQAVRDGDELVAQVMKSLAESFANERNRVEGQLKDGGDGSTESLRIALRRYRSFFERLLTL